MSASSLIVVGFSHLLSCFDYDESLKGEVLPEPELKLDYVKDDNPREEMEKGDYSQARISSTTGLQLELSTANRMMEENDLL